MKKVVSISTKKHPNILAKVKGRDKDIHEWPAFDGNNTRFVVTVPYLTGNPDQDMRNTKAYNITHQPSGMHAVMGVKPFTLAKVVADAFFVMLGDLPTSEKLTKAFDALPQPTKKWLRDPTPEIPANIQQALKKMQATPPAQPATPAPSILPKTTGVLPHTQFTILCGRLRMELDLMASKWSALAKFTNAAYGINTLEPTRLN